MKFKIIKHDDEINVESTVGLRLEQNNVGGEVTVEAYSSNGESLGTVVAFEPSGLLYRSTSIDEKAGFQLNDRGRIKTKYK